MIAPYDPKEMIASYLPPSKEHILGTNDVGQDIFSEMVYGTRVSLYIGIFAAFIVTGVGTVLALVSGYFGGVADKIITAITNIAMAVPSLPLTVLLIAYLESRQMEPDHRDQHHGLDRYGANLRARVMQLKELPFIKIEKTMGVHPAVILFKHILPNIRITF